MPTEKSESEKQEKMLELRQLGNVVDESPEMIIVNPPTEMNMFRNQTESSEQDNRSSNTRLKVVQSLI